MIVAEAEDRCADSLFLRSSAQFETLPSVKQSFKADGLVSSTPAAAVEENRREQEDERRDDTQSRVLVGEDYETGKNSISQGPGLKCVFCLDYWQSSFGLTKKLISVRTRSPYF